MAEEMNVLEKREIWEGQDRSYVETNPNFARSKPIPCIWVHKAKTNDKGFVYRFRSRLVVRGDLTIEARSTLQRLLFSSCFHGFSENSPLTCHC